MGLPARKIPVQRDWLSERYRLVRGESELLCAPLELEDYVVQTMDDVSPAKWHLAHTTWFFEAFVLSIFDKDYKPYHPQYDYLFNSYYLTHGKPFLRPDRGLLSRPTVRETYDYRHSVDARMSRFIQSVSDSVWDQVSERIVLGLNHEQQHQELILTDIMHVYAQNPLQPAYRYYQEIPTHTGASLEWIEFEGGLVDIGHDDTSFSFDNEGPSHQVFIQPYALASRLVTNDEYLDFIEDGGYETPEFWFSEAWSKIQQENWQAPLYWQPHDEEWCHFTLEGLHPLQPCAPVYHVSQFEADAYARWAGKRLPTEFEWENAAAGLEITGNLREQDYLKPIAAKDESGLQQIYGDVWEWTASPYSAYPGYQPASGSIGEYNGKFMSSQMVLRGGSFATPTDHIRATYRNFFYPGDRWQFSGIRLADDL